MQHFQPQICCKSAALLQHLPDTSSPSLSKIRATNISSQSNFQVTTVLPQYHLGNSSMFNLHSNIQPIRHSWEPANSIMRNFAHIRTQCIHIVPCVRLHAHSLHLPSCCRIPSFLNKSSLQVPPGKLLDVIHLCGLRCGSRVPPFCQRPESNRFASILHPRPCHCLCEAICTLFSGMFILHIDVSPHVSVTQELVLHINELGSSRHSSSVVLNQAESCPHNNQ
jgi:hypothetical protein